MSHETLLLIEVGGILLVMAMLARVANKIGQSAIPLYMTVGLVLGTGGFIPLGASEEFLQTGSEIGVIMLLLLLGLEYSPQELVRNLKKSGVSGVWDMLLNAVPGVIFGLLLGWGPIGAAVLGGVTWVSSSGVIVKMLRDFGRLSNRETPVIIAILVMEDLAMAFYLPIMSAVAVGATIMAGFLSVGIALGLVVLVLLLSYFFGHRLSRIFNANHSESLILGVSGLAILVAGIATQVQVSAAVGAFLVGIGLSGQVAANAEKVLAPLRDFFAAIFFVFFGLQTNILDIPAVFLPALALAAVTMLTKFYTGYFAARRVGIARPGRWRAGLSLTPRGEFSIIIAGLAISAGVDPRIAPFAATYMLITVIAGPVLTRLTDTKLFKKRITAGPAATGTVPIVTASTGVVRTRR